VLISFFFFVAGKVFFFAQKFLSQSELIS